VSTKQVIVMRKDLKMRRGKQIAQGAHASMKVFLDSGKVIPVFLHSSIQDPDTHVFSFELTPEMKEWVEGIFTKICVSVNSKEELHDIYNKAKEAGLPCALITDSGLTEFNGIPTDTCCAIGPASSEDIDKITGGLTLL